jgi:protein-L-isoaspartate(D-aspartate) O-methyltransferase
MAKVPRHEFVPVENHPYAYASISAPIDFDETISQPLMVAVMTDLIELKADDVVLEIGTGLGYHPQFSPSWRAGYTAWKSSRNWRKALH